MYRKDYQIVDKGNSKKLTEFFCPEGQLLLPLVELINHTEMAPDELIDVTGRAAIGAVLALSPQELAGPRQDHAKRRPMRVRFISCGPACCTLISARAGRPRRTTLSRISHRSGRMRGWYGMPMVNEKGIP